MFYTSGTAILSAGVFSGVAKSRFFADIFLNLISDVVFGEKFIKKRADLEEIWGRISSAICDQRFPELKNEIHERVAESLPRSREYYYEEYVKDFTVEAVAGDGKLRCVQHTTLKIKPYHNAKEIFYVYKYTGTHGGGAREDNILINGEDFSKWEKYIVRREGLDEAETNISFEIKLPLGEYTIEREIIANIDPHGDPYLISRFGTYAKSAKIIAHSEVPEYSIRFEAVGKKDLFRDSMREAERRKLVAMENARLIMPGEGHILLLVPSAATLTA